MKKIYPSQLAYSTPLREFGKSSHKNHSLVLLKDLPPLSSTSQNFSHFLKKQNKVESNIQVKKESVRISQSNWMSRRSTFNRNSLKEQDQKINEIKEPVNNIYRGYNRLTCQKRVNIHRIYPRFKIIQLHSLHQSIIRHAGMDFDKYVQGFESILNFQKISLKNDVIKKCIIAQKSFTFKNFMNTFKKLEDLMFIQNITDYLEIIFEPYCKQPISKAIAFQILRKRSQQNDARNVAQLIFRKLGNGRDEPVSLNQILLLCEQDIAFSSCLNQIYQQELSNSK